MNCNAPSCHSAAKMFSCCGTNSLNNANGAGGEKPDVTTKSLSSCCWMTFSLSSVSTLVKQHPAHTWFFLSLRVTFHDIELIISNCDCNRCICVWCVMTLIMYTCSFIQYAPMSWHHKVINRKTFILKEWQLLFWHHSRLFVAGILCHFLLLPYPPTALRSASIFLLGNCFTNPLYFCLSI